MGRTCNNICERHKAAPAANRIRYQIGQKRCTFCGIFVLSEDARCMCCKAVLRTKPRSRKAK
jgi:hypothetical protein